MHQKYGLIGFPLEHSFSKLFFTDKFTLEGIDASYELYALQKSDQLKDLLAETPDLKGLNVTIPYKKEVIQYLHELSTEAGAIGAVNTISIVRHANSVRLKGWNTDAPAFEKELEPFIKDCIGNAMVLGNGGAAAAACYVLNKNGWKVKRVVRKTLPGNKNAILFDEINREIMEDTCLIVNATPMGMFPKINDLPPLPLEFIDERHFVFDMIYNPGCTRLMSAAKERGASICNGLGMLHRQAELAWKIWQATDD